MRRTLLYLALLVGPAAATAQGLPPAPPAAGALTEFGLPPIHESSLRNGLRVVHIGKHDQPLLTLSLAIPAGPAAVPGGGAGVAKMMAHLLLRGAGARDADELLRALAEMGGRIEVVEDSEHLVLRVHVLSPHAATAFELLADAALRPRLVPGEIERVRDERLRELDRMYTLPASTADRVLDRELHGDRSPHAYGADDLRRVTLEMLADFHGRWFRPEGSLLTVVGDISQSEALRLGRASFGAWEGAVPPASVPAGTHASAAERILLVHRPGSTQSVIRVGATASLGIDPQYEATEVAVEILSRRLWHALREEGDWVYYTRAGLLRRQERAGLRIEAATRTSATDSVVAEIRRQLQRIADEVPDTAEVEAARASLAGALPRRLERVADLAAAVERTYLLGLTPDHLRTYRLKISAVDPRQVRAAARALLRPPSTVVVDGDAASLYDSLQRLAPVEVVRPDHRPL